MGKIRLLLLLLTSSILYSCRSPLQTDTINYQVDICVYGATSAGVIAAYSAAKRGKSVLLIGADKMIGGLTTGGLGKTDAGKKEAITGLSRQFYKDVGEKYGSLEEIWNFEPHVALEVYQKYMEEENVKVLLQQQLAQVERNESKIKSLSFKSIDHSSEEIIVKAKVFLDCTYEGDLMAMSKVSFTTGREGNDKYGETLNGFQLAEYHKQSGYHQFPDGVSPYKIPDDSTSGLLWGISENKPSSPGVGDSLVQAYNFRVCLTDSVENQIPITRPNDYDSTQYELLVRLFESQPSHFFESQPSMTGINQYFIWSPMPNRKTDVNNRGGFSTDMIGMNQLWPEADYGQRQEMIEKGINYTKGLLYFFKTDERVPDSLRKFVQQWGYPKDEYQQFGNFSPQIYVREARRMVGEYVMTEHNCVGDSIVKDGIALATYKMDSHNCQRIVVNGMVKNEGNVEVGIPKPYPISYRSITPQREECQNLLVPVCLSASHIAFGSIRMEPVFMMLGQAAAVGATLAIDENIPVQQVNYNQLKERLLNQNNTLNL